MNRRNWSHPPRPLNEANKCSMRYLLEGVRQKYENATGYGAQRFYHRERQAPKKGFLQGRRVERHPPRDTARNGSGDHGADN